MPFIITTISPIAGGLSPEQVATEIRHNPTGHGFRSSSAVAVATLAEARDAAIEATGGAFSIAEHEATLDAVRDLPESGGIIGPLPDGYVVDVQAIGWAELANATGHPAKLAQGNAQPIEWQSIYDALVSECRATLLRGAEIGDGLARAACGYWHAGQGSAFYSFASSGHYDRGALLAELSETIGQSYSGAPASDRLLLDMLGTYFINRAR